MVDGMSDLLDELLEAFPTIQKEQWAFILIPNYMPKQYWPSYFYKRKTLLNFGYDKINKRYVLHIDGNRQLLFAKTIPGLIIKAKLIVGPSLDTYWDV